MSSSPLRRSLPTALLAAAALLAALPAQAPNSGSPVGFEETWALAADRRAAVAQLLPGSDDWYYYSCRERLDARDFASVDRLLPGWLGQHGRSERMVEIENRRALLGFDQDPTGTLLFLRQRLGLTFDQQRQVPGAPRDLPTKLAPELLESSSLALAALRAHPNRLDGFTDAALPGLATQPLDEPLLRSLLERLDRPDVANLPDLVVRDLQTRNSRGFGSLPIHRELRLEQLEACLRLLPALAQQNGFVTAYLQRLAPSVDRDWQRDPMLLGAQLERLWNFAQRLPNTWNSLKAHVRFHQLQHDLAQGRVDRERLLSYLRLPRRSSIAVEPLRSPEPGKFAADLTATFASGLPPVGDERTVVRRCLEQLFVAADTQEPFGECLEGQWLDRVFAETKLLAGQGDAERWFAKLGDRAAVEALQNRVELDFAPAQRTRFGPDEAVALQVDVKNVPTLLVKVFAIDTFRYHTEKLREIDASIDLDGVVPNHEASFAYPEPPVRRVRRTFDLPQLREPGTYVVELVGNGISSRAVVHKGWLRAVERPSAAGHRFTVFDEAGTPVPTALLWFGGREYLPDAGGRILLPYSTDPSPRVAVVRHGNRSALVAFQHAAESYTLAAGMHVEREALVAGAKAQLLLRPELRLGAVPIDLALLREPVVTLFATDLDGTTTQKEFRGLALANDRELVVPFTVPERLQSLRAELRGTLPTLAGAEQRLTTSSTTFTVNGIDATAATGSPMLVRTQDGYVLELRGKNGEPLVGAVVQLALQHRDYTAEIPAVLQSDRTGRIELGAVPGITAIRCQHGEYRGTFRLDPPRLRVPQVLHGRVGSVLRLPLPMDQRELRREWFALLGQAQDEFAHLAIADGCLELRDLAAGDYELRCFRTGERVAVRITDGPQQGEWLVGGERVLAASPNRPLVVREQGFAGEELRLQLGNHSPETRVHVVALRYHPGVDLSEALASRLPLPLAASDTPPVESSFHSGRQLGDEYRYVLERRLQPKFAGNMLRRPSLLLHPFALDEHSWNAAVGLGGGAGGKYGGRAGGKPGRGAAPSAADAQAAEGHPGTFANLDALPSGAVVLANLQPGADGVLRIPAAQLGGGHWVQFVAVDGHQTLRGELLRQEQPWTPRSRTLVAALPLDQHRVERRGITFAAAGELVPLGDPRSAQVEWFDSLESVFRLLAAAVPDPQFREFAFLLGWPKLTMAEKQERYGQHACHELHFFLYHKDRPFFDAVVRPLLQQKLAPTFLDHWLLGHDLRAFTEPWQFGRLHLVEKILLAQRLGAAEQQAVARLLRESLEASPQPRERLERWLDLAFQSQALDETAAGLPALQTVEPGNAPGGRGQRLSELRGKPSAGGGPAGPTTGGPATAGPAGPGAPATVAAATDAERLARRQAPADAAEKADQEAAFDSNQWNTAQKAKDGAATGAEDFFLGGQPRSKELAEDAKLRAQVRQLYRAVGPTRMLVEHDYWHRQPDMPLAQAVAANRFWLDFALAPAGKPFASAHIVEASGSVLEALLALAVLDLPFTAGDHELVVQNGQRSLRPATPLLLAQKDLAPADAPAGTAAPLLLGENFFRLDDRYRFERGERRDAFVGEEFLAGVAYGCQVVVTNPSSQPRTAELLLQVPAGAIPVQKGFWTKGRSLRLEPYATQAIEYAFYFPGTGTFDHYPVHATEQGRLVAHAAARQLRVVATPSQLDTTSWEHVSQQGTTADVLRFVAEHNLQQIDLGKVAWRLRERSFYEALLAHLRTRQAFDATVWSHALWHGDAAAVREFLRHQDGFVAQCGMVLDSPLLDIEPVARGTYHHLELDPLVQSRAHQLGGQRRLGNAQLAAQYRSLLTRLGYLSKLDAESWLLVTYYLLLQDRVEEALASFAKVDRASVRETLQYDYLAAYLAFFTLDGARARQLAEPYREHPVPHWRQRFADVLAQLDEAEGKARPGVAAPGQDQLAASAPSLELELVEQQLTVRSRNLERCEVCYYALDVEFAFSAQPFGSTGTGGAAFVQPARRDLLELGTKGEVRFEVPESLRRQSVRIEVRGGGLLRSQTWFRNDLSVRFLESYGQVAVAERGTDRPVPKAYVKVFARLANGQVRFHKDGYTDLRGRFDYASVSDDPNANATRYAVLVLDDQRGALIRDVAPPSR
ncbi:MAG: hypothetical protein JNK49_06995 [Planctomycetes bacterium]|nr:hypothetical protein [Planctomycetota bacterium]